jgi:hypothetical protein
MNMFKNIAFRIFAGLVLLAAIAGIAYFAYQAGVNSGAVANLSLANTETVVPFYLHYWNPFFGFGIFGLLFVFFLAALAMGAMRRLFWGSRWDWRHLRYDPTRHGLRGHYGPWSEGVPPMFTEWHRRVHATPGWDKTPEGDKAPEENQK